MFWRSKKEPKQRLNLFDRFVNAVRGFASDTRFYDIADRNKNLDEQFENATDYSADAHLSRGTREIMRARCRYEFANGPYLKGMTKTRAVDRVGTGPKLKVLLPKEKFEDDDQRQELSREIQKKFADWMRHVKLAKKFRIMDLASVFDAEGIAVLGLNDKSTHPVKLDVKLVDNARLRGQLDDDDISPLKFDGVAIDEFDNPTHFRLLKNHPGNVGMLSDLDDDATWFPAVQVIYWYEHDFPEQHRGAPEASPSIEPLGRLRRFAKATVEKAETQASITAVFHTNEIGEDSQGAEPFLEMDITRNSGMFLPDGYEAQEFGKSSPPQQYGEFSRDVVTEGGRPLCLSRNKATGNSSEYNYASGRLDHQSENNCHRVWRDDKELDCSRIFTLWFQQAVLVEGYLSQEIRDMIGPDEHPPVPDHVWYWDGFPHVDPQKEVKANQLKLETGQTTLTRIWADQGLDWEEDGVREGAKSFGIAEDEYRKLVMNSIFKKAQSSPATEDDVEETVQRVVENVLNV